jgi:hypothetical protein
MQRDPLLGYCGVPLLRGSDQWSESDPLGRCADDALSVAVGEAGFAVDQLHGELLG